MPRSLTAADGNRSKCLPCGQRDTRNLRCLEKHAADMCGFGLNQPKPFNVNICAAVKHRCPSVGIFVASLKQVPLPSLTTWPLWNNHVEIWRYLGILSPSLAFPGCPNHVKTFSDDVQLLYSKVSKVRNFMNLLQNSQCTRCYSTTMI